MLVTQSRDEFAERRGELPGVPPRVPCLARSRAGDRPPSRDRLQRRPVVLDEPQDARHRGTVSRMYHHGSSRQPCGVRPDPAPTSSGSVIRGSSGSDSITSRRHRSCARSALATWTAIAPSGSSPEPGDPPAGARRSGLRRRSCGPPTSPSRTGPASRWSRRSAPAGACGDGRSRDRRAPGPSRGRARRNDRLRRRRREARPNEQPAVAAAAPRRAASRSWARDASVSEDGVARSRRERCGISPARSPPPHRRSSWSRSAPRSRSGGLTRHADDVPSARIMIGIGGSFDMWANDLRRAPRIRPDARAGVGVAPGAGTGPLPEDDPRDDHLSAPGTDRIERNETVGREPLSRRCDPER